MLRLVRTAEVFSYQHRDDRGHLSTWQGRRGRLFVGTRFRPSFPTVELVARIGEDGTRHPYVWLRPGVYVTEMTYMENGRRALRFLPDGLDDYPSAPTLRSIRAGRLYAHDLSGTGLEVIRPHHLQGCPGIGLEKTDLGVAGASVAFDTLALALGGFDEGVRFPFEVQA